MSVNTVPEVCPKCLSDLHIRPKILLIGKASPAALFPEERAGYRRSDQLAIDECKAESLQPSPFEQFIEGYYCENCGIGFVPDSMIKSSILQSRFSLLSTTGSNSALNPDLPTGKPVS